MGIRLIAYNIMLGGVGRADPIAEVLLGRRPDVIGVHEASNGDVLRRMAKRLNMDFVVAETRGGPVALFSRFAIVDSTNVAALIDATMPVLDATLDVAGRPMHVRVAHLTSVEESDRMGQALINRVPDVMLMSYDAPVGLRVVDGVVGPSDAPLPADMGGPVRQLDQVLVRPEFTIVEQWAEQDRLAYYASDHLPGGAEIEFAATGAAS